ncbi:MAG: hypothetical protein R3F20_09475 [Planctomycetota bacterium]
MRDLGLLLALLVLAAPLRAHDPPPYHLDVDLKEDHLAVRLSMFATIYEDWTGLDPTKVKEGASLIMREHGERLIDLITEAGPVWIDGVAVRPTLVEMKYFTNDLDYVSVSLRYTVLSPPRSLRWQWHRYRIGPDWEAEKCSLWFYPDEETFLRIGLKPREPEYTWHAPAVAPTGPAVPISGDALGGTRPTLPLPALSAALALAASILAFAGRRRLPGWATALVLVAGVSGAIAARERYRVEIPIGAERKDELPDRAEAIRIFSDLHRNVYRAFDYETESAIYDALARSVEGEFLDRLYDQVYQSLIVREEGGAVAKIHGVSILDTDVTAPEPGVARFEVKARWQVRGIVEHFGHKHLRTNEYVGTYVIVRRGADWRIAGAEIESQKRVGNDEAFFETPEDRER